MSLALWEFFWTEADWVAGPPPPPPAPEATPLPDANTTSGGGGGKLNPDDEGPHPDLWDVREAYLRQLFEKVHEIQPTKPVEPPPADDEPADSPQRVLANFFPRYTAELGEAITALRLAESTDALHKAGTRVAELVAAYAEAKRAADEDASKREIAYRARQAERLARKKAAIVAANILLKSVRGN